MPTKKRYIEVLSTKLRFANDSVNHTQQPAFADILNFMNNREFRSGDKSFEFTLLRTQIPNCIVGIIITTLDKDIPPKRHKRTKVFHSLDIDSTVEGLAFANIFLYDIQRNIFLYEINKNGCFPKQLRDFIYAKWGESDTNVRFDLSFPAILKVGQYNRMLRMRYYKRITVKLLRPQELISRFEEETDSIENNILKQNLQLGVQSNTDLITLEQVILNKRLNPAGLSRTRVKNLIDAVMLKFGGGLSSNIQTLEVEGYSEDVEDKALKPIDLLADTFHEFFRIQDIQIQSDVQQSERKEGIENLYLRLENELNQLIQLNDAF